jgi:hypothetical protein
MAAVPPRSPAPTARRPAWTQPDDVLSQLRRRWQTGAFLAAFAGGDPWQPLGLPVRGPSPREAAERLGDVQAWADRWEHADRTLLRVEYKKIGGRLIGSNAVPCRVWVDAYDQLWRLLSVRQDVHRFTEMINATRGSCPRLTGWLMSHPMKALELAACWTEIAGTVRWIDEHQLPGMYLRQVDVPGVDTKFIERHRGVLADLLDLQLNGERIDADVPQADFAGRYRFRRKPECVRFRLLSRHSAGGGPPMPWPGGFSELSVRAEELTAAPPGIARVYVVENEITYLAFPPVEAAMVIFGRGYAVPTLESLAWLAHTDLVYWGDIDTHGFAILDRLRSRFSHARSILMNRATLVAHRSHWVTEPNPAVAPLERLNPDEGRLYEDLLADAFGPAIRLEQERVRFSALEEALRRTEEPVR